MFDRETVERLAFEADWFETVKWMSEHPEAYLQGVRNGFVAVDAKGEKETNE